MWGRSLRVNARNVSGAPTGDVAIHDGGGGAVPVSIVLLTCGSWGLFPAEKAQAKGWLYMPKGLRFRA